MSTFYRDHHRVLQDRFDTRRLADKIEALAMKGEIEEQDKAFIESRDMFWLSTVDDQGQPTVSYKGGEPGFVKVVDHTTLAFPSYDGNGMFYSVGNMTNHAKIGMLFMDFERPFRLRVHGTATVSDAGADLGLFKEAQLVVRVAVEQVFINCPRYVHRYQKVQGSRYAPRPDVATPMAGWKRIDMIQDDLPASDKGRAEKEGGLITIDDWFEKLGRGDVEA